MAEGQRGGISPKGQMARAETAVARQRPGREVLGDKLIESACLECTTFFTVLFVFHGIHSVLIFYPFSTLVRGRVGRKRFNQETF